MRVCHNLSADFDDPNLIASGGLVPVMALAQKAGLPELVAEHVNVPGSAGANAELKVAILVAGMVAGADSIEDSPPRRDAQTVQRVPGPDHPETLTTRSNLASWRGQAGDAAGAAAATEELLTDRVRVLGPDHPDTLMIRFNLAGWRGL